MDDKKPNTTLLSAFIIAASIIVGAIIIGPGTENSFQTCMKEAREELGTNLNALNVCTR